ncbi:MAG: RluA family pseudouridine synthase [Chloroflexi bacterium]|nr:RluA family pseudouridine synthase [Chloroflexota bacterium]
MSAPLTFRVGENGERLDKFVTFHCPTVSRSAVKRLIEEGLVEVNGRRAKPSHRLSVEDVVTVEPKVPEPTSLQPQDIPVRVVYEDSDIIVVDKPPNLPVHPSPGHPDTTLVNALLARCRDLSGIGGVLRPGIVHRLDKDTSGLLVVAKNDVAHRELAGQIKERQVRKGYLALVQGRVSPPQGRIEGPIGRDPRNRKRMAIVPEGREAATNYRVLKRLGDFDLLEVFTETGRTHQIRVHLASAGHPIAGDALYGGRKLPGLARQFLHAHVLGLRLPRTKEYIEFRSDLPEDLASVLASLEA